MPNFANEEPYIKCSGSLRQPPPSEEQIAKWESDRKEREAANRATVHNLIAKLKAIPGVDDAIINDHTTCTFWLYIYAAGRRSGNGWFIPRDERLAGPRKAIRRLSLQIRACIRQFDGIAESFDFTTPEGVWKSTIPGEKKTFQGYTSASFASTVTTV